MNVQLGIYEIYSTIIPGIVYLAAVGKLFTVLGVVRLDWRALGNLSVVSALGLLVIAYLLGIAFGRFGVIWNNVFKRKDQSVESLAAFKHKHGDRWTIDVRDEDWHILLAYIRSKNIDLAREIERHLAASIMLRNVSFGFFLLAVITLAQYFVTAESIHVFSSLAWFVLSFLTIRESVKSRRWYYDTILSTIVAQRIDLEKSIMPVSPAKRIKRKKRDGQ